jgi:hypothetical protein
VKRLAIGVVAVLLVGGCGGDSGVDKGKVEAWAADFKAADARLSGAIQASNPLAACRDGAIQLAQEEKTVVVEAPEAELKSRARTWFDAWDGFFTACKKIDTDTMEAQNTKVESAADEVNARVKELLDDGDS